MKRSLIDEYSKPIDLEPNDEPIDRFDINDLGNIINTNGEKVDFSSISEVPISSALGFNNLTMKYNYERVLEYGNKAKLLMSKREIRREDYEAILSYRASVKSLLEKISSYPNNHYFRMKSKTISKVVAVKKCSSVLIYIDECLEKLEKQLGIIASGKKVD